MAIEYVRILTCDKCGKTKFLKHIPDPLVTFQFQFETIPDDWIVIRYGKKEMILCPDCRKKYEALMQGAGFNGGIITHESD